MLLQYDFQACGGPLSLGSGQLRQVQLPYNYSQRIAFAILNAMTASLRRCPSQKNGNPETCIDILFTSSLYAGSVEQSVNSIFLRKSSGTACSPFFETSRITVIFSIHCHQRDMLLFGVVEYPLIVLKRNRPDSAVRLLKSAPVKGPFNPFIQYLLPGIWKCLKCND